MDDGELAPGTEPRGTGVNKYTYWACTDCNFKLFKVLDEWTDLPIVTPD